MGDNISQPEALAEIKKMERLRAELVAKMPASVTGTNSIQRRQELDAEIRKIDQRVAELKAIAERNTSPAKMVNQSTPPTVNGAGAVAGDLLDRFLRVTGRQWKGSLVDLNLSKIVPVFEGGLGRAGLDVGVIIKLGADLRVVRENVGVALRGRGRGEAKPKIGVGAEIGLPFFDTLKLAGGIQGGAMIVADVKGSAEVAGRGLRISFHPFKFDLTMASDLYLEIPIPDKYLNYLRALSGNIRTSNNRVIYELGTLALLTITTPSYHLGFDFDRNSFVYASRTGATAAIPHPTLKRAFEEIYQGLQTVAQQVRDALDPVKQGQALAGALVDWWND